MNLNSIVGTAVVTAAALISLPVQAVLVTDSAALGGGTTLVDFEAFDGLLTSGPEPIGAQLTFTGDSAAELGAFIRDLGDNGIWGAGNHFAAGGISGELRFTLADGLSAAGFGAFVNHYAFDGLPFALAIEVSAYGQNNQIIETHSYTVDTDSLGFNEGQFLGIYRAQADINAIAFKGVGVVVDDLNITTAVPEPASWALMLAGGLAMGYIGHRRRAQR